MRVHGKKRNAQNKRYNTSGCIKSYFKDEINLLLTSNSNAFRNLPEPYVSHPEAEKELEEILQYDELKNKVLWFTGLTGSGKSTILQHMFEYSANTNGIRFKGNDTIIIPVDFNRSHNKAQAAILSSLGSAIGEICKRFSIKYPHVDDEDFFEYVSQKRPDVVYLNPNLTSATTHKEMLHYFKQVIPEAFASLQLQYVLDKTNGKIKLVVLVVDNVEAYMPGDQSEERYVEPLIVAFKLSDCINKQSPHTWGFNMVISCRHYIYRIAKPKYAETSKSSIQLESFGHDSKYDLSEPVGMKDIVKKRDETISPKYKNKDRWEKAVTTVNAVLRRMEDRIGDFILQLNLKDIRKSMNTLRDLVLNCRLQNASDEEITPGSFNIDSPSQFNLSRVNLIRTIGLESSTHYTDDGLIPNLLFNAPDEGYEIYPLLTLKYFLRRCNYQETSWEESISISEFYKDMKRVFNVSDEAIAKTFGSCIRYFLLHRVLLRSADQSQDDVVLNNAEIKRIEKVYVPGLTICLWKELSESSALFQLFMDDIWFDQNEDYLNEDGNNLEHCCKYLHYLWQIEDSICNKAENLGMENKRKYMDCFGSDPVCKQLGEGLYISLKAVADDKTYFTEEGKYLRIILDRLNNLLIEMADISRERRQY